MFSLRLINNHFSSNNWFILGLLLSFSSIVKPVSFYLILPFYIGVFCFLIIKKIHFSSIIKYLSLVSIPMIIIVGGWLFRNYLITGNLLISHIQALDLFYFKAPAVLSIKEDIPFEQARVEIVGERDVWPWILKNPRSNEIFRT